MSDECTHIAAVLHGKLDIRLEHLPIPTPGINEVQIRVKKVGICGTDLHLWQEGRVGDVFKLPMVLGHECSGVVSQIGEGVTHLKNGDRVCVEPLRPCRSCRSCKEGRLNVCPDIALFYAPAPNNGVFCQYVVQDEYFVHKLPDNIGDEEGAMIERLAVALRACYRTRITKGDTVLICGAGPIGLSVLLAAKASDVSSVLVTDIHSSRLDVAKQMGATHTLLVRSDDRPEDISRRIKDTLGCSPDKAVECSGEESAVQVCVLVLRSNGVLGLVGVGDEHMNIPIQSVVTKEIDVVGVLCFVNTFPRAIDMVASRTINMSPLVTHRFPLREAVKAMEMAKTRKGMKIIVECDQECNQE